MPPTQPVTTTTLEQTNPGDVVPSTRPLPATARIELAAAASPELVRWLYATVGGPWQWTDRLAWQRDQWADELARPGSEVWLAYDAGTPAGYVQLAAVPGADVEGTAVEILYFGLQEWAIGRGIGGALLTHGLTSAWSLGQRHDVPDVTRVWVHTCSLDGPHALSNYTRRGLRVIRAETKDEPVAAETLGAWRASGGPAR